MDMAMEVDTGMDIVFRGVTQAVSRPLLDGG